jgi:hypothetical protein
MYQLGQRHGCALVKCGQHSQAAFSGQLDATSVLGNKGSLTSGKTQWWNEMFRTIILEPVISERNAYRFMRRRNGKSGQRAPQCHVPFKPCIFIQCRVNTNE